MRPEPDAKQPQQRSSGDIKDVVLIGRQHRDANEHQPPKEWPACDPRHAFLVQAPENHKQRDVQGRRLIEGLVEARQGGEQQMWESVGRGPRERELQRKQQKTYDRHDLRGDHAPDVDVELVFRATHEDRQHIENVDRTVRNDRPCQEWNVPFPADDDRMHVGPSRRDGVRKCVSETEKQRQKRETAKLGTRGQLLVRIAESRDELAQV
jgi:hypothetical protein